MGMIKKNETIQILQSIADRLNIGTVITTAMVEAHHITISKHDIGIIKAARDHLVSDWERNYFPKPSHFREYILSAENKANIGKTTFNPGPNDVSSMSARVRKLVGTSERNIERRARNKDKSREPCGKCDKPAIMNLTADDYCHYWNHPVFDKYRGKYLCGRCVDELNKSLKKGVKGG
jgi:hypothetical protein